MKTNPLNHIKIASPCSADWDEMLGDNRKRFCSLCQLNVYNISEMSQREAENFLFQSEGRVCVRLYRRKDGTVITQDCPVGWQAVKRKVSRVATAAFGLIVGFLGGLWSFNGFSNLYRDSLENAKVEINECELISNNEPRVLVEEGVLTYEKPILANGRPDLTDFKEEFRKNRKSKTVFVGRVENVRDLQDEPVELWVK